MVMRLLRTNLTNTAAVLGVLLLLPAPTHAQALGRVSGRVLDQTGAVLPGVTVDLVVDTKELTTTSNARGEYRFDVDSRPLPHIRKRGRRGHVTSEVHHYSAAPAGGGLLLSFRMIVTITMAPLSVRMDERC